MCTSSRGHGHKVTAAGPRGIELGNGTKPNTRTFQNAHSFTPYLKMNGDFVINGRPLLLKVEKSERSALHTGLNVWDGGICLAKYLEHLFGTTAQTAQTSGKKRVLELGCGTGVA